MAQGTVRIALGYTEPDGGSDIAEAKTRAVRDGDEWVINGQKIFTSNAQYATHIFLITRTDPTLPKHKGLTMFLVPTSSPGFERQPLPTIGDETTNVSFYSDIRLPTGTGSARSTTAGPRCTARWTPSTTSRAQPASSRTWAPARASCATWPQSVEAAVRWAKDAPDGDGPMIDDKAFLAGIGHMLVEMEAAPARPTAMGRVKGSDMARLGCEELIDLVGPAATLPYGAEGAIGNGVDRIRPPGGPAHRDPRRHRRGVPHHHRPARPGAARPDYPGRKVFLTGERRRGDGIARPVSRAGPGSVLVLDREERTANGSGQLRLLPRELEPRGEFRRERPSPRRA